MTISEEHVLLFYNSKIVKRKRSIKIQIEWKVLSRELSDDLLKLEPRKWIDNKEIRNKLTKREHRIKSHYDYVNIGDMPIYRMGDLWHNYFVLFECIDYFHTYSINFKKLPPLMDPNIQKNLAGYYVKEGEKNGQYYTTDLQNSDEWYGFEAQDIKLDSVGIRLDLRDIKYVFINRSEIHRFYWSGRSTPLARISLYPTQNIGDYYNRKKTRIEHNEGKRILHIECKKKGYEESKYFTKNMARALVDERFLESLNTPKTDMNNSLREKPDQGIIIPGILPLHDSTELNAVGVYLNRYPKLPVKIGDKNYESKATKILVIVRITECKHEFEFDEIQRHLDGKTKKQDKDDDDQNYDPSHQRNIYLGNDLDNDGDRGGIGKPEEKKVDLSPDIDQNQANFKKDNIRYNDHPEDDKPTTNLEEANNASTNNSGNDPKHTKPIEHTQEGNENTNNDTKIPLSIENLFNEIKMAIEDDKNDHIEYEWISNFNGKIKVEDGEGDRFIPVVHVGNDFVCCLKINYYAENDESTFGYLLEYIVPSEHQKRRGVFIRTRNESSNDDLIWTFLSRPDYVKDIISDKHRCWRDSDLSYLFNHELKFSMMSEVQLLARRFNSKNVTTEMYYNKIKDSLKVRLNF